MVILSRSLLICGLGVLIGSIGILYKSYLEGPLDYKIKTLKHHEQLLKESYCFLKGRDYFYKKEYKIYKVLQKRGVFREASEKQILKALKAVAQKNHLKIKTVHYTFFSPPSPDSPLASFKHTLEISFEIPTHHQLYKFIEQLPRFLPALVLIKKIELASSDQKTVEGSIVLELYNFLTLDTQKNVALNTISQIK